MTMTSMNSCEILESIVWYESSEIIYIVFHTKQAQHRNCLSLSLFFLFFFVTYRQCYCSLFVCFFINMVVSPFLAQHTHTPSDGPIALLLMNSIWETNQQTNIDRDDRILFDESSLRSSSSSYPAEHESNLSFSSSSSFVRFILVIIDIIIITILKRQRNRKCLSVCIGQVNLSFISLMLWWTTSDIWHWERLVISTDHCPTTKNSFVDRYRYWKSCRDETLLRLADLRLCPGRGSWNIETHSTLSRTIDGTDLVRWFSRREIRLFIVAIRDAKCLGSSNDLLPFELDGYRSNKYLFVGDSGRSSKRLSEEHQPKSIRLSHLHQFPSSRSKSLLCDGNPTLASSCSRHGLSPTSTFESGRERSEKSTDRTGNDSIEPRSNVVDQSTCSRRCVERRSIPASRSVRRRRSSRTSLRER